MGARPVAVMDPLRFGPADAPDTRRVLPGVVAGVGGYGNCLGLPNIGGEVVFDRRYAGNPLVNALCVGVMRHDRIQLAATGSGNIVVLLGAKTGRDGIGGRQRAGQCVVRRDRRGARSGPACRSATRSWRSCSSSAASSCTTRAWSSASRTSAAPGSPAPPPETAAAGADRHAGHLERVPLREASMEPHEILMSESQERMMAIVEPAGVARLLEICARWDVPATVIGEVTDTGRLEMTWHGEQIVDIPPGSAADDGPVYQRPLARPDRQDELAADDPAALPRPSSGAELRAGAAGADGLAEPGRQVLGHRAVRPLRARRHRAGAPQDAGLVRVDEETGLGMALATDGNGRYARLDPYAGAQLALAEAYRNVAATGARPLAVTNCLNFGSPEDPAVMWQFAEAVRGPGRRLPHPRRPGDRRQRELLQPDRRGPDPPDPGRRRPRRHRRRPAAAVDRLPRGRRERAAPRPHRRGVRRVAVGQRRTRASRRAAACG